MKQHPFNLPLRARGMLEEAIELSEYVFPAGLRWPQGTAPRKLDVRWGGPPDVSGVFQSGVIYLASDYANWWEGTDHSDPVIAENIARAQLNFLHEAGHAHDFGLPLIQAQKQQIATAWGRDVGEWWNQSYPNQIGEAFAWAFAIEFSPKICAKVTTQNMKDALLAWRIPAGQEKIIRTVLKQGVPVLPNTTYRPRPGFDPLHSARDWVELCFVLLLGRLPDDAGHAYWAGITEQRGRDAVVVGISGSPEFQARHARQP
jgi:hypothetical protein